MEKILQHFIGYLTAERGLARNSTSAYSSDLEDYVHWLHAQGIGSFDAAGRDAIIDYLEYCRDERALETVSIARRLVAIKILYRYLFRERLIAADVTDVMDSPKFWRILPDFLSVAEVDALLLLELADDVVDDPLVEVLAPKEGVAVTVLAQTTRDSQALEIYEAQRNAAQILTDFQPGKQEFPVVLLVEAPKARALLVGDVDYLHNSLCINNSGDEVGSQGGTSVSDNATLLTNAAEYLCADARLLRVRSRGRTACRRRRVRRWGASSSW